MKVGRFFSQSLKYEVGVTMTAIAHALSRAFQSTGEFDILKQIAVFCGVGLLVALVCLSYGLDLSPGFF
jgi:ribose/xylose/arabinose/galactoside ABC-type transport system permease subunit